MSAQTTSQYCTERCSQVRRHVEFMIPCARSAHVVSFRDPDDYDWLLSEVWSKVRLMQAQFE